MGEAEIAGAVGSFVGVFIAGVKWAAKPMIRQFNYLCCFSSNLNSLKDEAQKLDHETRALQERVVADENNARLIFPLVQTWLKDSDNLTTKMKRIVDEAPNVQSGGCLKLRQRFSLSREAKKTTKAMEEHLEKCKFSDISHPPPIAASAPVPPGRAIHEFYSRRQIEEEIMTTLEGTHVNTVGICGMGGVGKTTMARMIRNKALEKGLFNEVVFVVVSQPADKLNIQQQIAELLGLKVEEKTLNSRAHRLRERLREKNKTLIVLDDVWERLNLEELGIPCEGCKILITSRNMDVLTEMNAGKICGLQILSEEESWFLFRERAGTCVDETIAKDVMRECKGLPLALATVGVALKYENDICIWEDALRQLRKCNPSDIPNIITEVYNPIKLSYDRLNSENAKSMFLLCCLFAEDANISLETLTCFAVGLRLYKDIGELDEVRGRVRRLISTLKTRCLLLDGEDEDRVKMHDVVRDVSIFIASEEKRVKCSDCTWISSYVDGRSNRIRESGFPKLNLLLIDNEVEQEHQINNSFIGGTTELNVLFVRNGLLKSLPHITQLRTSLTTLILDSCESLESISTVGQFKSLEIFICYHCHLLKELPVEAIGLEWLRLLEIFDCPKIERVAAGVISSLIGLEELKMVDSFHNWEGEDGEGKSAGLKELESLIHLRFLKIEVWESALAAQPLCLSPKLLRFDIQFGHNRSIWRSFGKSGYIYRRVLSLYLPLVNNIMGDLPTGTFLTLSTEYLRAVGLINSGIEIARGIWDCPVVTNSNFKNLKVLRLDHLPNTSATLRDCVLQLEYISIYRCHEMEQLVLQDKECDDTTLIFPELKSLCLVGLQKLTCICKGIQRIEFPKLVKLDIRFCKNMKCFVSTSGDDEEHYRDHDSSHLFCQQKVSFSNLKELGMSDMEMNKAWCDEVPISFFSGLEKLIIIKYTNITSLFSSSIAQNLDSLQYLSISSCDEMVNVIEDKEEVSSDVTTQHTPPLVLFPSLQELWLYQLPKLESFCEWSCDVELPSLKKLRIIKCPQIKSFSSARSVITPALQTISIDRHSQDLESVKAVNAALQKHFQKLKRISSVYCAL